MTDTEIPLDAPIAERIALAEQRYGAAAFVERAVGLLQGRNEGDDPLLYVGGRHAQGILDGAPPLYWPELWGARALLYVWDDSAAPAVLESIDNRAWRVREMCLKVCAERSIGDQRLFTPLLRDENARVRSAAGRALAMVGDASMEGSIRSQLRDPDKNVRRAAGESLGLLLERVGPADKA